MGCSASRLDVILAKAIEDPLVIPKTQSLTAPLVHHPATGKGDTHHLVCLTSSTYGSLVVVDKDSGEFSGDFSGEGSGEDSPESVINTWELMEGLEGEDEFSVDNDDCVIGNGNGNGNGKGFKVNSLSIGGFDCAQKIPSSNLGESLELSCDFDGVQKRPSLRLGERLELSCDFDDTQKKKCGFDDYGESLKVGKLNSCDFDGAQKKPGSRLGLNLSGSVEKLSDCGSYVFVEMPRERNEVKELNLVPNSKPLWKHLSEESLLSKLDPNVESSYQRALSARKLGYEQPRRMSKSMGSSPFALKSMSLGSSPAVSKLCSDNACRRPGAEDKIVLYFTSLRGIRRTYEDCCSVRMILRGFRVVVDEKDISMDSNYRKELQSKLGEKVVSLPQLFIGGMHVGGADEIKQMHEIGELGKLLEGFPIQDHGFVCERCGESRFVPCSNCNGSRKVFQEEEGRMRRCLHCNENGLVRCPDCCS